MADYVDEGLRKMGLSISKPALAFVCIVMGIVVILLPTLIAWIVGLFLMVQGALLLADYLGQERRAAVTATSNGVQCHNCKTENVEDAVYCSNCGNRLAKTEPVVMAQPQQASPRPEISTAN